MCEQARAGKRECVSIIVIIRNPKPHICTRLVYPRPPCVLPAATECRRSSRSMPGRKRMQMLIRIMTCQLYIYIYTYTYARTYCIWTCVCIHVHSYLPISVTHRYIYIYTYEYIYIYACSRFPHPLNTPQVINTLWGQFSRNHPCLEALIAEQGHEEEQEQEQARTRAQLPLHYGVYKRAKAELCTTTCLAEAPSSSSLWKMVMAGNVRWQSLCPPRPLTQCLSRKY